LQGTCQPRGRQGFKCETQITGDQGTCKKGLICETNNMGTLSCQNPQAQTQDQSQTNQFKGWLHLDGQKIYRYQPIIRKPITTKEKSCPKGHETPKQTALVREYESRIDQCIGKLKKEHPQAMVEQYNDSNYITVMSPCSSKQGPPEGTILLKNNTDCLDAQMPNIPEKNYNDACCGSVYLCCIPTEETVCQNQGLQKSNMKHCNLNPDFNNKEYAKLTACCKAEITSEISESEKFVREQLSDNCDNLILYKNTNNFKSVLSVFKETLLTLGTTVPNDEIKKKLNIPTDNSLNWKNIIEKAKNSDVVWSKITWAKAVCGKEYVETLNETRFKQP